MKKRSLTFVMAIMLILVFTSCEFDLSDESASNDGVKKKQNTPTQVVAKEDPIVGNKTSFKDLKIGDTGKKGEMYVGLQYVKSSSTLPTAYENVSPKEGYEVILAFFEFLNGSKNTTEADSDGITCYADGVQVGEVETWYIVRADGVSSVSGRDRLDSLCQYLTVRNFEVPVGWKELKFFYKSDCVWTITPTDVSKKPYLRQSLYSVSREDSMTPEDTMIFNEGYSVQLKGARLYHQEGYVENDYVIFKFRITNNSDSVLDTSLMGYLMRGYQNNYLLRESSFTLDDKIDGFTNIYYIDSIESGMSADIYIAFESSPEKGVYRLTYDDGYIMEHNCGYVYVEIK